MLEMKLLTFAAISEASLGLMHTFAYYDDILPSLGKIVGIIRAHTHTQVEAHTRTRNYIFIKDTVKRLMPARRQDAGYNRNQTKANRTEPK